MRILCYFADLVPQSRCSMWRFGWLTDKHAACPPGLSVVVNLDNELYVPEACGRVEIFDAGTKDDAVSRLVEGGLQAGYRLRKRGSAMGSELPEPDTRVEPFVVRENSLLASHPHSWIFALLAGPNRVYEGDDGELYLQDPNGRWFHYLEERLLDELRRSGP
jgi:hypothetical protein